MDYQDLKSGHTLDNFWFRAKNDLILVFLNKTYQNRGDLKILNIGVGTGDDLSLLKKFGKNYIIDINKDAMSSINPSLYEEKIVADASSIPYENNFFDLIICSDVLEHLKDDQGAVVEIYRVLKNKGVLIFTVPAFQFLFSSHDKALFHQRRYNKKSLKKILSNFSLSIFFWNSLLFPFIAFIRIIKRGGEASVDNFLLPRFINNFFYKLLKIDNFLIKKGISMPFGLSLVGFGIKNK